MSKEVPKSHPRYVSLSTRNRIVEGVEKGVTSPHGLIAQGRGEAFDYLIGEKSQRFSLRAIEASAAMLLLAKRPVLSVNGNVAALVGDDLAALSELLPARTEVNIFHGSKRREKKIAKWLRKKGIQEVLLPMKTYTLDGIESNRRFVNREGIFKADVVFVPLEDGDRCEALVANHKKVITVDLNPFSRTAQTASITIVDNIVRVMPLLIEKIESLRKKRKKELKQVVEQYNNKRVLSSAKRCIGKNLT